MQKAEVQKVPRLKKLVKNYSPFFLMMSLRIT